MSIDPEALDAAILNALGSPKRVSGDAGEVEQQSIADLIAAHKYLSGLAAANSARRGLRFTRLVPDGAVQGPNRYCVPDRYWGPGR